MEECHVEEEEAVRSQTRGGSRSLWRPWGYGEVMYSL